MENNGNHIPFPETPLTPEERTEKAQKKEPKLKGAPEHAYESALVAADQLSIQFPVFDRDKANEELKIKMPALEKVGKDLEKFQAITQVGKQRDFIEHKFNQFCQNPQSMEEFFDILRILQESGVDGNEAAKLFNKIFDEQFEKLTAKVENLTPESLGGWLELSVKSPLYKEQAEKILKSVFERSKTVNQTMSTMYSFALATLNNEDPKVFRRGIEILNFGTDILSANSQQHKNFYLAKFGNDEVLQKHMEVDAARTRNGLK